MESAHSLQDRASPLAELEDINGVLGSMVVSHDGALLMHRLPAGLAQRAEGAAPRLAALLDAISSGRHVQSYSLRFAEHRLLVLPISGAFLCVLAELWSSAAVLKMALNVLARRLS